MKIRGFDQVFIHSLGRKSFNITNIDFFKAFIFRLPFKLDYNDLQYDKINKHIQLMFKEYNKSRKLITPTTEYFFERALLEKNIENF